MVPSANFAITILQIAICPYMDISKLECLAAVCLGVTF